MGIYQGNDLRKKTGGRKRRHRKPRKYELGEFPTEAKLGERERRVVVRVYGSNIKVRAKEVRYANVYDPETNETKKVRILKIVKTPANPDFARRGIIIKGAIIETELGLAEVTSRPGQDGVINAILLKE
ncbi:MAG TPA: 30S ribosomal protein S8e [Acidilobales archaeon]|nr:30S ribosomal protein S8e [Acidilobales archaeon]